MRAEVIVGRDITGARFAPATPSFAIGPAEALSG